MGMRKVRNAKVTHVGRLPHYVYEDRNGISTLTGIEEWVQIVLEVTDPGPEHGREITVRMNRKDAADFIGNVSLAITEARDKERSMGLPDSEAADEHAHRGPTALPYHSCTCGRPEETIPALHDETCPVWAQYRSLT